MDRSVDKPPVRRCRRSRFGLMALFGLLAACGQPDAVTRPLEGEPFPDLALTADDGRQVSIGSFRGKLLVMNVWATWCPPCRREMPSLERLSRTADARRFSVIGLSVDRDTHLVREFLRQYGVTFPSFLDPNQEIARKILDVKAFPETFLIAPDGRLVRRIVGEQEWHGTGMREVLEAAYRGERAKTWAYERPGS